MFPLRDDNPTEILPFFTVAIIAACVAVWVLVQGGGMSEGPLVSSVCTFGAIPAEITGLTGGRTGVRLAPGTHCPFGGLTWEAAVTSMFLHGSWMHLIGNMWFLWIFGNNIEDSMGHLRFLLFYLLTGMIALGAHVVSQPDSPVPTVGASGAISAIMGAYLILYPRARIDTLFWIIIIIKVIPLPAWLMLGYWFLIQLASSTAQGPAASGGVAFWAHIGGFIAGLVMVKLFSARHLVTAKRSGVRLSRDQIPRGGWW
jgi:membrane associated rhomboid family serine protease